MVCLVRLHFDVLELAVEVLRLVTEIFLLTFKSVLTECAMCTFLHGGLTFQV